MNKDELKRLDELHNKSSFTLKELGERDRLYKLFYQTFNKEK